MLVALGADVVIFFQIFFPDDLPALVALDPQTFRADFLLARSVQLTGLALKPCHEKQFPVAGSQFSVKPSGQATGTEKQELILDSSLRHHALLIRVLDLTHFGYRVS